MVSTAKPECFEVKTSEKLDKYDQCVNIFDTRPAKLNFDHVNNFLKKINYQFLPYFNPNH